MLLHRPDKRRILVVDDDRAIVELVCARLSLAGYETFSCGDGEAALRRLDSLKPVGMVLDLSMPSVDGFQVLERMGRAGTARTATLVLTARHGAGDVQRAIALGARDYLTKPFEDAQLLARMARLFRKRPESALDADSTTIEEVFD